MKTLILTENQIKRVIDNIINEQEENQGFSVNFDNVFESGQYKINPNYESTIVQNIRKIYDYIQNKQISKFTFKISSSESQVPNPINPDTKVRFKKGELAKERSRILKEYLEILIPRTLNIKAPVITIDAPLIGNVPWDGVNKDDAKYKKDQYVKVYVVVNDMKQPAPYERKSDIGEGVYMNNRLVGFISQPFTDTKSVTDTGLKNLNQQELIFTEVVPDTQPPKIISKYKIPYPWWNDQRSIPGTKHISKEDLTYIQTKFPKIS